MAAESKRPEQRTPQGAFGGGASDRGSADGRREDAAAEGASGPRGEISGLGFGVAPQRGLDPAPDDAGPHPTEGRGEESGVGGIPPPPDAVPQEPSWDEELLSDLEDLRATAEFDASELSLGAEEVVLDEIDANANERSSDIRQPPLGYAEGHDAWTADRISRQSTVPPQAEADVRRLRELSARCLSEFPDDAWDGGALDLVDHSQPSKELGLLGEMEDLYALDDLTGALRCAELVLGQDPENEQARVCAENCRSRLQSLYASKIGNMEAPVVLALADAELRWLGLDHRSGFLLSRVDGLSNVEELLDICGMPRLEALKALVDLFERGAIKLAE